MMKCRKGLVAGVVAVCMMGAMGVNAFAEDTVTASTTKDNSTTVKYEVSKSYEWTVPTTITFESNKGIKQTDMQTGKVNVTKNIINDGETLKINIKSGQKFTIKNGNTELNYTVKNGDKELKDQDLNILSVKAGKNADEATLTFTLSTTTETAEVAGEYRGTLAYEAVIE